MRSAHDSRFGLFAKRSFTLVELLVVITIITILASLLLPVLGKAMGAARRTRCSNNQKQFGVCFSLYEQEHGGWWPAPYYGAGPDSGGVWKYDDWQLAISNYLYPGRDLRSARFQRPGTAFWCTSEVVPTSSASADPADAAKNSYRYAMNRQLPAAGTAIPKRPRRILQQSKTGLIIEVYSATTSVTAWHFHSYNGNIPHDRGTNILFADLHGKYLREADVPTANTAIFWQGE